MLRVFAVYTICSFYTIAFAERGTEGQKGLPKVLRTEVGRSNLYSLPVETAVQQGFYGHKKRYGNRHYCINYRISYGAGSGGRTRTVSLPLDFESSTSANSIIPANCFDLCIIRYPSGKIKHFFSLFVTLEKE